MPMFSVYYPSIHYLYRLCPVKGHVDAGAYASLQLIKFKLNHHQLIQ